jgi:DNA-binding beta-propeller fold protein YncE
MIRPIRIFLLTTPFLFIGICVTQAQGFQHALAQSVVRWLDVPDGEYIDLAVSPDGTRAYFLDQENNRVVVYDAAADTVASEVNFTRWLSGMALTPDGSQLIVAASAEFIYTVSTTTLAIIGSDNAWEFSGGKVAVTPDGSTAYVAAGWDIYVARLTAAGPELVDTSAGTAALDGLVTANPGWAADFVNANNIVVSADGNSLYVGIWRDPIHVISGIASGTNHTGLNLQTLPLGWDDGPAVQLCLSNDGNRLYDSSGQVRSTSDLSLVGLVDVFQSTSGEAIESSAELLDVVTSPDDSYIYYAAFANVFSSGTSRITHHTRLTKFLSPPVALIGHWIWITILVTV